VVDVFYVTDLFGAKITSATRQATIKRALIALLSPAPLPRRGRPRARRRAEIFSTLTPYTFKLRRSL
jgi:[protein-PII] uridylyltransferase